METVVYWGYSFPSVDRIWAIFLGSIGIMEKKMETTIL